MWQPLLTVRDLIRYGVSAFNQHAIAYGHGTDNAYDEAVQLVLHALYLHSDILDHCYDARLLPHEREAVVTLLHARIQTRKPAAYLTHTAYAQGFKFYVDERVIVPRSFIGELFDADALAPWLGNREVSRIADICTGSAAIAIQAAHAYPDAAIDAVDLSRDALAVAARNVGDYQLDSVITLHQGSLFAPLAGQKYDLIVSNPPYVNAESMQDLPAEYKAEPYMALSGNVHGGTDGMDLVRDIVAQARAHLNPNGVLVIEIGNERAYFEAAFAEWQYTWLPVTAGEYCVALFSCEDLPQNPS